MFTIPLHRTLLLSRLLCFAIGCLLFAPSAFGETYTGSQSPGVWNQTGNWSPATVPGSGDSAIFNTDATFTDFDGQSVGSIQSTSWTLKFDAYETFTMDNLGSDAVMDCYVLQFLDAEIQFADDLDINVSREFFTTNTIITGNGTLHISAGGFGWKVGSNTIVDANTLDVSGTHYIRSSTSLPDLEGVTVNFGSYTQLKADWSTSSFLGLNGAHLVMDSSYQIFVHSSNETIELATWQVGSTLLPPGTYDINSASIGDANFGVIFSNGGSTMSITVASQAMTYIYDGFYLPGVWDAADNWAPVGVPGSGDTIQSSTDVTFTDFDGQAAGIIDMPDWWLTFDALETFTMDNLGNDAVIDSEVLRTYDTELQFTDDLNIYVSREFNSTNTLITGDGTLTVTVGGFGWKVGNNTIIDADILDVSGTHYIRSSISLPDLEGVTVLFGSYTQIKADWPSSSFLGLNGAHLVMDSSYQIFVHSSYETIELASWKVGNTDLPSGTYDVNSAAIGDADFSVIFANAGATMTINVAAENQQPLMFGVNLAGGEFGDARSLNYGYNYIYPNESEFDYYHAKGLDLIRIPFRWERVQPTPGGALRSEELARLDTVIGYAQARGMQVILDMHNYAHYKLADGNSYLIGSTQVTYEHYKDVWNKLADHWKNQSNIYGYGIMNEPHATGGTWPIAAQAAADGIRLVDSTHWIIVGGEGWSGAHSWRNYNENLNVTDPLDMVIYEAHQYFDDNNSGTYNESYDDEGAYPNIGVNRVQPFIDWLAEHNHQGFIGEYGVPDDDSRWNVVLENFLAHLQANGVSGTYWAGGPWWGTYPMSCEPDNGVDAPQMQIIELYTGE